MSEKDGNREMALDHWWAEIEASIALDMLPASMKWFIAFSFWFSVIKKSPHFSYNLTIRSGLNFLAREIALENFLALMKKLSALVLSPNFAYNSPNFSKALIFFKAVITF